MQHFMKTSTFFVLLCLVLWGAPTSFAAVNDAFIQVESATGVRSKRMPSSGNAGKAAGFAANGVFGPLTLSEYLPAGTALQVLRRNAANNGFEFADVSGTLADGDKGDVVVSGTGAVWAIDTNSVALGTDTTGNYVATIADSGASEITVANSGAEGAGVTLAIAASIARDAEVAAAYQPTDADLTDLADGSLSGSKVGSGISAANITTGVYNAPEFSGVTTFGGGFRYTPSPMTTLEVDITKGFNTKTLAANSTFTWNVLPSIAGQSWGAEVKNSSGGTITVNMPTCRSAFGGASVSSFTIAAGGLESVWWQYNGTEIVFSGGVGAGSGSGSGFPLTADTDAGNFDLTGIQDLVAVTVSGDGNGLTNLSQAALPATIPSRLFEKITTSEAILESPTPITATTGATTMLDTTRGHLVMTLNEATEVVDFSGVPAEGSKLRVRFIPSASTDVTVQCLTSVYSNSTGNPRTEFKVRQSKPAEWFLRRSNGVWLSDEPTELADLTDHTAPAGTWKMETMNPTTGSSGDSTIDQIIATNNIKTTRTGVRRTIYINAGSIIPRATNGAVRSTTELATNDIMVDSLDFADGTELGAGFWCAFPTAYNSGTVTANFEWTAASSSGTVKWDIAARGFINDDALDQALGTEQTAGADTLLAVGDMHVSSTTSAITIGGTPTPGRGIYFQVTRDTAGDTLAAAAQLLSVTLEYTESTTEPAAQ